MSTTSHAEFGANTEALEVAQAFPERIKGKTILVTGVNRGGVGFTTAQAFASQSPAHLIIAGRNPEKVQECIDALRTQYPDVKYHLLKINLSSQKSVREAAAELLSWNDIKTLDLLVNNAAIMNIPERELSEEGIELTFATNHIGHYLFTCLVMPRLREAAKQNGKGATRVINVTSLSPLWSSMRWSDINQDKINKTLPTDEQPHYATHQMFGAANPEEQSYLPLEGYNQSKVANVLFSIGLNERLYNSDGILSFACHPGLIETELVRYATGQTLEAINKIRVNPSWPRKSLGAGASTSVLSAVDPKLGSPTTTTTGLKDGGAHENYGVYLMDCQISDKANPKAVSSSEAAKLWTLSEELVNEKFAF